MKKTILLLLAALAISCTPKDSLTVMSYNVRTSVKDDGENSWENRKEASKAMLEEVKPDIFGVQEARLDQERYIAGQCPEYISFGVGRDDGADEGERASVFYTATRWRCWTAAPGGSAKPRTCLPWAGTPNTPAPPPGSS